MHEVIDLNPTKLIEAKKACTNFSFLILNYYLSDAHSTITTVTILQLLQFTYSHLYFTLKMVITKNKSVSIYRNKTVIFNIRFVSQHKSQTIAVFEEGVSCKSSPLLLLRGHIWEEVVLPAIIRYLDVYWNILAKRGRTLEEAAGNPISNPISGHNLLSSYTSSSKFHMI